MSKIAEKLSKISYRKLVWAVAITETIHNLEEAIWLPAWSKTAGKWHPAVGAFEFRFADAVVTIVFYGVIYYFATHDNRYARFLMGGALVGILFNVFVPHLAGTIFLARYAPGVASGVLLNVPVASYLLWRGLKEGIYRARTLVFGALAFGLAMIPLIMGSFALV